MQYDITVYCVHCVINFILDSQDNLVHMAVDNLADHTEAVMDTEQEGMQDSRAAVVHSQAAEHSLGSRQLAAVAANSCKGCNLLAMAERWDTAYCSELSDMVLLALHFHTYTYTTLNMHITQSASFDSNFCCYRS